ncbi:probably inactive leucine-rich repeat receptor-like protein kinase At5g48380 [Cynara cardunculus var. scolymus]|uniref:probably inactive leucine-rich repeat receptor-like protein kinase At5g48380 n=1 Tax=Cynara cardunculus var. scolymus TaxID=59895 RepID=UPI000D624273|nr:probably inactive leucine-rich repeat receptor-like protein kinase At5g48380 [Cynara cardunculus var. scolymus]
MAPSNKAIIVTCIWMLICIAISNAVESDINCLRSFIHSVQDPENVLSTWDFTNRTEGFICRFTGVDCWHPDESKVLNIRLPDMGLKGTFPLGLQNCTSMTGLDLSSNHLSGTLPANISRIIPLVTTLDLSSNNFSGPIPMMLSNCTYLNSLILDNNHFSGQIPLELGQLTRLKEFRVANNLLSGPVPTFRNGTIQQSYGGNTGLCGGPLRDCSGSKKNRMGVIVGAAIGGATLAALLVGLGMTIFMRKVVRKRKVDDPDGNKWAKSIKGAKTIKLSMFENPVSKMRLSDLMKATNSFSKENIIGSGRTGCLYKAVLEDGSSLMIKRLQDSKHSEKEFQSEMATLGKVKHRNLVPLLGFCVAKRERLLVYKYMANGNLHDKLHPVGDDEKRLDWPSRLKIGIGAAKGFAWLHHNCNPRILHRNISSKCILLDADFEPRISDFGLARLMNPVDTHLSTFVNGEFGDLGYVAPEYASTLVATPKGDVYSFGVVLLELVTGERPTHVAKAPETFKGSLAEWVTELAAESRLRDSIDESLAVEKDYENEVFQFLKVASRCVVPAHKERPSMFEVYQLLRAIGEHYHFTTDDEVLMMPSDNGGDAGQIELIVARDVKK